MRTAAEGAPRGPPAVRGEHIPEPGTRRHGERVDPGGAVAEDVDPARAYPGGEQRVHAVVGSSPGARVVDVERDDDVTGPTSA
jgi:hypothetical protein